jgi:hypothetical protein
VILPEPGDICCVSMGGAGGAVIGALERLTGSGAMSEYQHVYGYIGGMRIVEAMPGGARVRHLADTSAFEPPGVRTLWSTGVIALADAERSRICKAAVAATVAGPGHPDGPVGYSWLDYAAVGAAKLHIPAPHLRAFVKSAHRAQCAQLWDSFWLAAGVHLFSDGRWEGQVDPADIAGVILAGAVPARSR